MVQICKRTAAFCWLVVAAQAQTDLTYSIRAFAGAPRVLGDNDSAKAALLWSPHGVSVDAAGNLYIADTGDARIRVVSPGGTITTIAGSFAGFAGDRGPAAASQVAFPSKAVAAPNGDIFIADSANNRVRRISGSTITTVAGTGQAGFNGDGPNALAAQLSFPRDVAVDASGNLYIADTNNSRIRRVTPQGAISTVAGSGLFGFFGDGGPAVTASLAAPHGIAVDAGGVLYIADTLNNRIRKVSTDGTMVTIAGGNTAGFSGDFGQAAFAQLNAPSGVAVDNSGNVYFADSGNHRVRLIDRQGNITTVAGGTSNGFKGDGGPATAALLNSPQSVAVDAAGNLYIADAENHRIRRVTPQKLISTLAGADPASGDGGLATASHLFLPSGVAVDTAGNVYISDTNNHRVRRVDPKGIITNFAGTGAAGYSGDSGVATLAQLNSPAGLAVDRAGNLYIADTANHAIRRVSGGVISTLGGTGVSGNTGDGGPVSGASFFNPNAVAMDRQGNLYVADSGNNRIRVITNGTIQNFAGDPGGLPGFDGDGGPAAAAHFDYPISVAIDDLGNVFVADYFNNRIRKVSAIGTSITTFAGTGTPGAAGDFGPAAQAQLYLPAGIAMDGNRNLYIADLLSSRIRVVGPNGAIRTIAGGVRGYYGDGGPGTAAALASPRDIAVDGAGNIYFSDQDNHAVRKLSPSSVSIKTIVNAASLIAGPVAPGEAISIYGVQLGGNVSFDGIPASVLYSSTQQVNAIVPDGVVGRTLTKVQVSDVNLGGDSFTLTVRDAAPGIFTINGSGTGQAAVINQDGTVNGVGNPAVAGEIVSVYATGAGVLNSAAVRIQGIPGEVLYAGTVGIGLFQVNVQVPASAVTSDWSPLELTIGTFAAQPGTTIAVK